MSHTLPWVSGLGRYRHAEIPAIFDSVGIPSYDTTPAVSKSRMFPPVAKLHGNPCTEMPALQVHCGYYTTPAVSKSRTLPPVAKLHGNPCAQMPALQAHCGYYTISKRAMTSISTQSTGKIHTIFPKSFSSTSIFSFACHSSSRDSKLVRYTSKIIS
jgi:hypothetical protein